MAVKICVDVDANVDADVGVKDRIAFRLSGRFLTRQNGKVKTGFHFKWRSQYNTDFYGFSRGQIS